mmetsp:Transcript_13287/g.39151  ORF Transcript_13287/g.39151 Transcript_13287/m.39151 type:complete len:354 (-) Transcript_13287:223-1284(-)
MLIPLEHVLLAVQIVIGMRLIFSLKAWLCRLEDEAASHLGHVDASGKIARSVGLAPMDARSNASVDGSFMGVFDESTSVPLPGPAVEWRTRPVMLRLACGTQQGQQVEFNHPGSVFDVETELFEGKMYFRLRGCAHEPKEYFFGKQRRLSAVVQGRFKQPLVMGECYTGYEFQKPFTNVPAPFLIRAGLHFIRTLAPTLIEDILGERPYFLNPLCQTIQVMHVAEPGQEPNIVEPFPETNAKIGGVFTERKMDRIKRKNYFAQKSNGEKHRFDPGFVYTMEFYEDKFDPAYFDLMIIGLRFNLNRYLGPQPLQIMGKHGSVPHAGDYLFNVEMWHESLIGPWSPERSASFVCL